MSNRSRNIQRKFMTLMRIRNKYNTHKKTVMTRDKGSLSQLQQAFSSLYPFYNGAKSPAEARSLRPLLQTESPISCSSLYTRLHLYPFSIIFVTSQSPVPVLPSFSHYSRLSGGQSHSNIFHRSLCGINLLNLSLCV